MKITIFTYGSQGDVQPFVPLSLRLMEKGHSVKLAAPIRFKNLVEEHKIDFVPLAGDPGNEAIRKRALAIGQDIRSGDRTIEAVKWIENILMNFIESIDGLTIHNVILSRRSYERTKRVKWSVNDRSA